MISRKKQDGASFDSSIKQGIDTLKAEVFQASREKDAAQTAVDTLTLRLSTTQALLTRAESSAASAEQTFHDGQVVAQTVLNGRVSAVAASQRAIVIRDSLRLLCEKACAFAAQAVEASQAADDFALGIRAQSSSNAALSAEVASAVPHMLDKSQKALAAALTALQTSMSALAAAEEAVLRADMVVRESNRLCQHLLPQAGGTSPAQAGDAVPVTDIQLYPLYQVEPPSLSLLVHGLDAAAGQGLLYLLDAIRQVHAFTRKEMTDRNSEIGMELNTAKHALDKATRLQDTLRASLAASVAAALGPA